MTKEILVDVPCVNESCGKTIPKVIQVKEDEKGPDTFEVTCPFCDTLLQAELPEGIALVESEVVLRGIKKL
ncbi:MAG: hypothetical protein AAGI49_16590 [Bacteroidota bacterium]